MNINKETSYVLITRIDQDYKTRPISEEAGHDSFWHVSVAAPKSGSLTERQYEAETRHMGEDEALRRAHALMQEHELPLVLDLQEIRIFNQPSIMALSESLTGEILNEIPEMDAYDFRDDDFENHALSSLREASVDLADEIAADLEGPRP